ncbi:MAG: type III-B CRISPR-associated protein Cas10/Cmr2 [Stygiobacter sp.]
MNQYLFLFTISPVQSFIAQARKTRDLYNGSRLLTDLVKFALKEIEPAEPIFPSKGLDSYPNRFIAIIEKENDTELKNFGDELKQKVQAKFEELALFSAKDSGVNVDALPDNFYSQIRRHLSIQWVAIHFEEEKYKGQFKEIESLLGAVKNVREFEQLEETGRKCSLCGERNVIFCQSNKKEKFQLKPNWTLLNENEKKTINSFNNSLIGVNQPFESSEGLCAVCFTKRFYQKAEFPSTAEIAIKSTIQKLFNKELFENYKKSLGEYFDYQLLYEENLTKKYFERQNIPINLLNKAREFYFPLKKQFLKENLNISPYYAIIMFDGDSMGKWLSGANLQPDANLMQFHKVLTKSLGNFAEETNSIVTSEKGKIVYAGGEDFLAFINLNHLFDVVKELRLKFDLLVKQGTASFKTEYKNLTFSAGIIIAHYKMPLSEVLNWARNLEKEAKNIDDDKNAFAIAVMKHSGEINQTIQKWGEKATEKLDVLAELTKDLANDIYSKSFINKLSTEFMGINIRTEILKAELQRLLTRSSKIEKKQTETNEEYKTRKNQKIVKTVEGIISLYEKLDTENLFSALFISEFISRHLNGGRNEN